MWVVRWLWLGGAVGMVADVGVVVWWWFEVGVGVGTVVLVVGLGAGWGVRQNRKVWWRS